MKPSSDFYKSPVHSHLHVSSLVAVVTSVWRFSLSKLFWSKELFKTQQPRKPQQFSVYFGTRTRQTQVTFYLFSRSCPLLPLTSRVVKRNSLIITQYQSKVCVLQSVDIKHTHTLACIYNGVWPGLMLQQSDNEGGQYQIKAAWAMRQVTCLIVIGPWGGLNTAGLLSLPQM